MGNQYLDFGWETGRKKSPPASSSYQSPSTQNDPWVKMLHSELIHSLHSFASPWSIQQTEGQTTALLRVVSSYIVFSLLPTSHLPLNTLDPGGRPQSEDWVFIFLCPVYTWRVHIHSENSVHMLVLPRERDAGKGLLSTSGHMAAIITLGSGQFLVFESFFLLVWTNCTHKQVIADQGIQWPELVQGVPAEVGRRKRNHERWVTIWVKILPQVQRPQMEQKIA